MTLQDILMCVCILVAIGVGAVTMYMAGKKQTASGVTDVLSIMNFCLHHIDQMIRSIEDVSNEIGGIKPDQYESDEVYRKELIDRTIHVIEDQLYKVGVVSPISHETLLTISQMVIDRIIEEKRKREDATKAIEEDYDDYDQVADISKAFSNFYIDENN